MAEAIITDLRPRRRELLLADVTRLAQAASAGYYDNSGEMLHVHTERILARLVETDAKIVAALYGALRAQVPAVVLLEVAPRELVYAASLVAGEPLPLNTSPDEVPVGRVFAIKQNELACEVMLASLAELVTLPRLVKLSPTDRAALVTVVTELRETLDN